MKFLAPPGFTKDLKGDWGVFTSKDGAAVFARGEGIWRDLSPALRWR